MAAAALTGLVGSVLVGVVLPSTALADEVYDVPSNGVLQVEGHGWGHGHGLSQNGAEGAASLGVKADDIVSFYYPHTAKTSIGNSPIRVLLQSAAPDQTQVYPASGLTVTDQATGAKATLPSGPSRWRTVVDSAGLHVQQLTGSTWTTWALAGKTTLAGPLQYAGPTFVKLLLGNGSIRDYRGAVRSVRTSASRISTIDVLSMEDYLLGVVPRESSASWLPAALQAQSIAARSYSAYKRAHAPKSASYDICDSTQCQVFGGAGLYDSKGNRTSIEPTSTTNAVHATAGIVRTYQGQPIFAEFSSSNGGWSTDGGQPYLVAQRDDWDGAAKNSVHSWTATLTAAQLQNRFPSIGRLKDVRVTMRDGNGEWGGRVKKVVLDGTSGSVDTTGAGVYNAHTWPASSDGLRSSWWHIAATNSSTVVSQSAAPSLVQSPGVSTSTLTVSLRNSGKVSWPVAGLHLAVSSPAGQADPLVGGSTTPGTFVANATHDGASTIAPGDVASFAFALTADGVSPGAQGRSYRLQNGTGALYGSTVSWTVPVAAPTYLAAVAARPTADQPAPTDGAPPAVFADGRTVVVPVSGSTTVAVSARNAGNVAWPSGSTVRLGTSSPRGTAGISAGDDWISSTRPSALTDSTPVAPGKPGHFSLVLHGNDRAVGVTTEAFEPVWESKHWLDGDVTALQVVRVDPSLAAAAVDSVPATTSLTNAPNGTAVLRVRFRNLGGAAWPVGQQVLTATRTPLSTSAWPSGTTPPALAGNVTRPGQSKVWPGEVGEWRVPVSAVKKAKGTYPTTLQVAGGPATATKVVVADATFTGSVVSTHPAVTLPSAATATTWFDVRNTGNTAWPVGGVVRSVIGGASSPSRASSWLSASRPGSLTSNLTQPGSATVAPGQVARFVVVLAGNDRAAGAASEPFGVLWEGWARSAVKATLAYRVS